MDEWSRRRTIAFFLIASAVCVVVAILSYTVLPQGDWTFLAAGLGLGSAALVVWWWDRLRGHNDG